MSPLSAFGITCELFGLMIANVMAVYQLKRIADALTGVGPNILTAPINSYGEGIGDAIQGQMVRGQRGVDQYEGR